MGASLALGSAAAVDGEATLRALEISKTGE